MLRDGFRLPDFVIAGACKCGTSSLLWCLCGHPELWLLEYESHFFDWYYGRGVGYYSGLFDGAGDGLLLGEKTPVYMVFPEMVGRMGVVLPGVRVIVLLRDPVVRAYSHWNMQRRVGNGRGLTFEDRVVFDMERVGELGLCTGMMGRSSPRRHNIIVRGMYVDQVRLLFEVFGRDRVHVVISERYRTDGEVVLSRVCDFLGVGGGLSGVRDRRVGVYDGVMGGEVGRLVSFYRPLNEELFELLGYEVDEWL